MKKVLNLPVIICMDQNSRHRIEGIDLSGPMRFVKVDTNGKRINEEPIFSSDGKYIISPAETATCYIFTYMKRKRRKGA